MMHTPAQHQTDPTKKPGQVEITARERYHASVPYTGSTYKPAVAHVSAQE